MLHYITLDPLHPYNMTANTLHSLHYITTTTPLRYNYEYSCSTPHYIQQLWVRWPLQPLQPLQQTQLQPPFGQSVDSLCHPWFTTTNLSYRFPILQLPPPPCAVLLVSRMNERMSEWTTGSINRAVGESVKDEPFNETNESVNQWLHIGMDGWMNKWISENHWMSESVSEWRKQRMNRWVNGFFREPLLH